MRNQETNRINLEGVTIVSVTSPGLIKSIAEEHGINPQEVFVRVRFAYNDKQYDVSNQLRFLKKEGYEQLLAAKADKTPINITITTNEKGSLFYVNNYRDVEISTLFETPVTKESTTSNLADLF